jgi:endonuclease/exonuclease/phosphatase family metal-dependent hydrolase
MKRVLASFVLLLPLLWGASGARGYAAGVPPTVRVLTYNIHHGEGMDGRFDLARLADVVKDARADLVALQEVDEGTQRASGVNELDELARLTDMHAAFGKAMDFSGGAYGVAVLSRWPLRGTHNNPLPSFDDREPRTALTVDVNVGVGGPLLEFTSTHLDQTRDSENRLLQAKFLNDRLVSDDGRATILAGDMNARQGTDVMDVFDEQWTDPPVVDPAPPQANGRPRLSVDHVLLRPALGWRVIESRLLDEAVASDHRPLLVVLEWTESLSGR